MKTAIGRIALILAGSTASGEDLKVLSRWVNRYGPERLIELVQRLRHLADEEHEGSRAKPISYALSNKEPLGDTVEKIESMLLDDVGMTRAAAAASIRDALTREFPMSPDLPPYNRVSFAAWLERVATMVPKSILLHVVAKIRNQYAGNNSPDWPLKPKNQ